MKLRDSLALVDDEILLTLFELAQFALNDVPTIQRVANELQTTEGKIEVLTGLAIDLSCGQHPEIKTIAEMDAEILKLATATK